jgi:putative nucleotidyltransferase with HDIG domain
MISREEALELLKKYVKKEALIYHSLASEAVMKALAAHLGEDIEKWGMAGLLHDIDIEVTNADLHTHGLEAVKILKNIDLPEEVVDAIKMHNEMATGMDRTTVFQHALAAGETITGLITATTLVYPDKKLASVKTKSVVKRMKEKAFAASVSRENILECEMIGIPISDFAEVSINAMREISDKIGL